MDKHFKDFTMHQYQQYKHIDTNKYTYPFRSYPLGIRLIPGKAVILCFKLDLFLTHSICQPDVDTLKEQNQNKKSLSAQEPPALHPTHKTNPLKNIKITT